MVVVVVCTGDVVVVVVVDGVAEVVVVEGCDGSTVVGDICLASGGTAIARRAGAVVGGTVTLVEVLALMTPRFVAGLSTVSSVGEVP
jgi:hypothetical protein